MPNKPSAIPTGHSGQAAALNFNESDNYFARTFKLFSQARHNAGHAPEFFFRIGGYACRLVFAGDSLYPAVTRVFDHLRIDPVSDCALTVYCWDSTSTRSALPRLPRLKEAWAKENDISYSHQHGVHFSYNHTSGILNVLNEKTATGIFWIENCMEMPLYEKTAVLKNLLSWWFSLKQCHVVHSAVIGMDKKGVLLSGKGGAGKSTTALACMKHGMDCAGDDYVLLSKNDRGYRAHSMYNSIKLANNPVSRYFKLDFRLHAFDPLYNKKVLFLDDFGGGRIAAEFQICAAVIPKIQKRMAGGLKRITPAQAFKEMAPSTVFQRIGQRAEIFRFLAELTRKIPCFQFDLSTDLARNPEVIQKLLEDS